MTAHFLAHLPIDFVKAVLVPFYISRRAYDLGGQSSGIVEVVGLATTSVLIERKPLTRAHLYSVKYPNQNQNV